MQKTLLDTDIFSEIIKGKNQNVIIKATQYFEYFKIYCISSITVMEIVKGLHKVRREEFIQRFLLQIPKIEILTLDVKSAEIAGRIYANLERMGQPLGRADPMIAGIAIRHNLILSTGNVEHYQRIQNMGYKSQIENWRYAN